MAVDLFCYLNCCPEEAGIVISRMKERDRGLFEKRFLMSGPFPTDDIQNEISLEYGLVSKSYFMVSLNEKGAASMVMDVINLLKDKFGSNNILILHGNEIRV